MQCQLIPLLLYELTMLLTQYNVAAVSCVLTDYLR
jgi:hypothetical protein